MGIVIRQSFWGTAFAYLGVLIGFFNTLYLRPEFLTLAQMGLFTLVTSSAMMISPFCSAGMPGTFIKYFPELNKNNVQKNQFFTLQLLIILMLNSLVVAIGYLGKDWIVGFFQEKSSEYVHFISISGVVIIANSMFDILFAYCRVLLRVIVPSFIRDVALRAGSVVLVGGYALGYWSFSDAIQGLAINYVVAVSALFAYLIIRHKLRLTFQVSEIGIEWRKKMINFGTFLMLLALSSAIVNNISYLQISTILGAEANAIFATCFFIGVIVELPRRSMLTIVSPLFSTYMKTNDLARVDKLYKKGSVTMSVFGLLLLIGILTNLSDLFKFIPQGSSFSEGLWVAVLVGLSKLFLMVFSFSQEILVYSKYNKYLLAFQLISASLLVTLNVFLIPIYGLLGVGISYLIATTASMIIRLVFLNSKLGLNPFTKKHLPLMGIGIFTLILFLIIPFPFTSFINIVIRSILTTLVFVIAIFKMKISPDINGLIRTTFENVLKIKL